MSFEHAHKEGRKYLNPIPTDEAGFDKMIKTYIMPLKSQHPGAPVHFVGSVAANFQDYLKESAAENGITIEYIIKEPINNLLSYYSILPN